MGDLGGWGTWAIGHMGITSLIYTAWIFTKNLLDIDIDVFYSNIQ